MRDWEAIDAFVRRANIERYQRLLQAEPDHPQRQTILMMLAQEEKKRTFARESACDPIRHK